MKKHARSAKLPFPAVAWKDLAAIPKTRAYGAVDGPFLVVVDANGCLIADSSKQRGTAGIDAALAELAQRIAAD